MTNRKLIRILALGAAISLPLSVPAQQKPPVDAEGHQWWQHAVFYEIYPRSFADSDNNGIGDLRGIDQHLDYLKNLGIDAVWITRASLPRKSISATTSPTTTPSIPCTAR